MKTKEKVPNQHTKKVKDPPMRRSPDTMLSCTSDFSCCYLSRQFVFCFTEATRVILGGVGGESIPFNTQHNWISQEENNT